MRSILAVVLLAALAFAVHAQVYKWTDSNGKVHYGDRPPDDANKQELRIRVPSYDGPVQVRDWASVIRTTAATPPSARAITMYSTDWCGHCKNARKYFAAQGIRFTEVNVEKSESGRKEYEALGGGGVPLIQVGDKIMRGFSAASFEALRKNS